jgi:hypothetical protein
MTEGQWFDSWAKAVEFLFLQNFLTGVEPSLLLNEYGEMLSPV